MERESKCGAYYKLHRINIYKARGLQNITTNPYNVEFMDRGVGRRVGRGACGTNAQIKNNLLA